MSTLTAIDSSLSNEDSLFFSLSSLLEAGASTDVEMDPWERDEEVVLVEAIPDFLIVLVLLVPAFALIVMVDDERVRPEPVDDAAEL